MNATAKSGSMPDEQPAMIEIVPVGATVVRLQLRSRRMANALAAGVAGAGRIRSPDRALPLREDAALLRQLLGGNLRLLIDEPHQLATERDAGIGVVGHAKPDEQVGPSHDAQPDAPNPLRKTVDLIERVPVRVDDVVEEMRAEVHRGAQPIPIHVTVLDEQADVDRAEVADVIRKQRLLAAGIGRLVAAEARNRVVLVGAVDVEDAGLTRLPGTVDDLLEYVEGVELPYHLAGARMDQVVRLPGLQREHERVGHGDRDVEMRDLREVG